MYTKTKKTFVSLLQVTMSAILAGVLLASCVSDSDEVSSAENNTCYVSGVTFSTLRRATVTKAMDGVTDSTYYTSFSASNWVFTIDHKKLFIENRDSLPYNTDLSRVVMNLSYTAGMASYRSSDAWRDDPWLPYQATDSIDFRQPVHIKLVATDNTERIYTLKMNVHTVDGDSLKWMAVQCDDAISGAFPMKAVSWNSEMCVLVNDGNVVLLRTHPLDNQGDWKRQVTDLPPTADLSTLSKGPQNLFVSTAEGALYASSDGLVWNMLYKRDGLRLVGVSNDKLYAQFDGVINSIYVGSGAWAVEPLDDDASFLPDAEMAALTYVQNENLTRMVIIGNRSKDTDTSGFVWSKCWTDFEQEDTESWMFYGSSWDNTKPLPLFTQMNLMYYDKKLMVAGGRSRDGGIRALERFYVSSDNGLTWWELQNILPPKELAGVDGYLAVAADEDNFIWIIAGSKVYRGRLNRLGFERPDIY